MCLAFTYRHSRTRDHNRVRDGVVDLILNRAVGRPTAGHSDAPHSCLNSANGAFAQSFKVRLIKFRLPWQAKGRAHDRIRTHAKFC
jgi:hypothetical protein